MNTRTIGQQSVGERNDLRPDVADRVLVVFVLLVLGLYGLSIYRLDLSTGAGLALDDGWIHLTFARNLVDRHIWSINPDGWTGGATSILWVLLLVPTILLAEYAVFAGYVLNGLLLLALGWLLRRVWSELVPRTSTALELTILTLVAGNLVWFVFSGMETLLILVLGLATIYLSVANHRRGAIAAAFLSSLARPDGFLVALAVVIGTRFYGTKPPRRAWPVLLSAALGLALCCLWNYFLTGTLLPSTATGRRWLIGSPESPLQVGLDFPSNFLRLLGVWGYRLAEFSFGQALLTAWGAPAWAAWIVAVAALGIAAIGFIVYLSRMSRQTGILLVWMFLQLFAYSLVLPTRGHAGRYQPVVLLQAMIFFWLGLQFLWTRRPAIRPLLFGFALLALLSLYTWNVVLRESLVHFDRVHIAAARWIDRHAPPEAKIAAFDIGALAFFADRPIVDLGGLLDPQAGHALYARRAVEYIASHRAGYLAMVFPFTDPEVYFRELDLHRLNDDGTLTLQKTFFVKVPDPYWPAQAARVMANEIRIYEIQWKHPR